MNLVILDYVLDKRRNYMEETKLKKSKILSSKVFFSVAIIILLSSGVLAFFLFTYDKEIDYQVVGSKGTLLVLLDFNDQIFNVSQNLSTTQDLSLVNQNGATDMFFTILTNVTNLDAGNCTISPGEVSFELRKGTLNQLISNNTNFTMNAGLNNFNFTATAINNRVCTQNITNILNFTEI